MQRITDWEVAEKLDELEKAGKVERDKDAYNTLGEEFLECLDWTHRVSDEDMDRVVRKETRQYFKLLDVWVVDWSDKEDEDQLVWYVDKEL